MFKALLIETLPQFSYKPEALAEGAKVPLAKLQAFLDPTQEAAPTSAEFAAIMKALPVSLFQLLPDAALDELSYLDAQLALVESTSSDASQPMFGGMRRLLGRLING